LRELYLAVQPDYSSSVTVPVLYDKVKKTIVNNESSELIKMLNSEFNEFAKNKELDLYPGNKKDRYEELGIIFVKAHLRDKIDEINEWIYHDINNGVYKCGFAKSQEAYDASITKLFQALDR
jgi:putative glutathione S-transferase